MILPKKFTAKVLIIPLEKVYPHAVNGKYKSVHNNYSNVDLTYYYKYC
jgi:hypothetical protein